MWRLKCQQNNIYKDVFHTLSTAIKQMYLCFLLSDQSALPGFSPVRRLMSGAWDFNLTHLHTVSGDSCSNLLILNARTQAKSRGCQVSMAGLLFMVLIYTAPFPFSGNTQAVHITKDPLTASTPRRISSV